jgi:hypothetical protein
MTVNMSGNKITDFSVHGESRFCAPARSVDGAGCIVPRLLASVQSDDEDVC